MKKHTYILYIMVKCTRTSYIIIIHYDVVMMYFGIIKKEPALSFQFPFGRAERCVAYARMIIEKEKKEKDA